MPVGLIKERLSDAMLTNLIEHYSQHKLNLSNVPDDSGHTAAEFYINRTVVKLIGQMPILLQDHISFHPL
jgi:hypothetical protein